jgi:hypothetical protein
LIRQPGRFNEKQIVMDHCGASVYR